MTPRCWLVVTIGCVLGAFVGGCHQAPEQGGAADDQRPPLPVLPERTPAREVAATVPKPVAPTPPANPPKEQDHSFRDAIQALQLNGPEAKEAVGKVIEALEKDTDPETRCSAAWALVKADPKTTGAVQALISALGSDPEKKVRIAAAEVLSNIGPAAKESMPALLEAMRGEDKMLRVAAVLAAARIDRESKDLAPLLIDALKDEDPKVRGSAATTLGVLGPRAVSAVPALIVALGDKVPGVRLWSAVALGNIGPAAKDAVPALLQALDDKEYRVCMAVSCALNEIDPQAPMRAALRNGGEEELAQLAKEARTLVTEHLTVLKGITDRASAQLARPKLDRIASEYDKGDKRMKDMPIIKAAAYLNKYHASFQPLGEELEKETARIKSLPEAYDVLKSQSLIASRP